MTSMSLEEDISELIQCAICIELLSDTRVLRCGHTFCLRCLQRYGKDKASGERVPCPVCRTQFQVPRGGFESLPRNFLLEKILEVHAASVAETSEEEVWRERSPGVRERRSVAVQSTQTIPTSTTDATEEGNLLLQHTFNEMPQQEQHQANEQLQGQQNQQPQQHRQQLPQQGQQQHEQERPRQHGHIQQQKHQPPSPNPPRRRPLASKNGWSSRLLMNVFLISLAFNFLLTGNLWYILDSMEQERANWTNRVLEFEEAMQKAKEESAEKQVVIDDHHLRCTERVESSLEECRNDIKFYKGFLQTVTKLLDSYTTPQQPTFSVM